MTFKKTIHSITTPTCIIYSCVISPNRKARSSNCFDDCHPFIMRATLQLECDRVYEEEATNQMKSYIYI